VAVVFASTGQAIRANRERDRAIQETKRADSQAAVARAVNDFFCKTICWRRRRLGHKPARTATTALVHEAYMRLVDIHNVEWRDRLPKRGCCGTWVTVVFSCFKQLYYPGPSPSGGRYLPARCLFVGQVIAPSAAACLFGSIGEMVRGFLLLTAPVSTTSKPVAPTGTIDPSPLRPFPIFQGS
jgi:hypothetical protein